MKKSVSLACSFVLAASCSALAGTQAPGTSKPTLRPLSIDFEGYARLATVSEWTSKASTPSPESVAEEIARRLLDTPKWVQLTVVGERRIEGSPIRYLDVVPKVEGIPVAGYPTRVAMVESEPVAVSLQRVALKRVASRHAMPPEEAIALVASKFDPQNRSSTLPKRLPGGDALKEGLRFRWGSRQHNLIAWQRWIPEKDGLHLGWELFYTASNGVMSWIFWVDGDGAVRHVEPRTFFSYGDPHGLVFLQGSPQPSATPGVLPPSPNPPDYVERKDVSFAGDPYASPMGWVGPEMETVGNNADVREDHDADWGESTPGERAYAADGNFSFPLQLGPGAPSVTEFVPAVLTNLFYWVNWAHDTFYAVGFTEQAGNFQSDNFGRGGLDGDPVVAFAQQGIFAEHPMRNNAYFSTPPDGYSPIMGMFVWGPYYPGSYFTDSALDADVIVHEFVHGITGRLGRGWYEVQSGAMNEGNSDFLALNFLVPAGSDPDGSYIAAAYAGQDFEHGIRHYPYSTDPNINPLTYADFGHVIAYPEPHADGEIWVEVLWEARSRLIKHLGDEAGRKRIATLLLDAMLMAPPSPSMTEMRDAMLLVDQVRFGGEDTEDLWEAFAERGLGSAAVGGTGSTLLVLADFHLPGEGYVTVKSDRDKVVEGGVVPLWIHDEEAESVTVEVSTSSGDSETILASPAGRLWSANVSTVSGSPNPGDGILQVEGGNTIEVAYKGTSYLSLGVRSGYRVDLPGPSWETIEGETDLGLHADDRTIQYKLPFDSEFAGFGGRTVTISTNGVISAWPISDDWINSAESLAKAKAIAPLWFDLRTDGTAQEGEGIYVAQGDGWVRFRWCAETVAVDPVTYELLDGEPVNFACTLFEDGSILFQYGPGNTGFAPVLGGQGTPTVGLGFQDAAQLIPGYDSNGNLELASAVLLSPTGELGSSTLAMQLIVGEQQTLVIRRGDTQGELHLTASSSDPSVAVVQPAEVTLSDGEAEAEFVISALKPGNSSIRVESESSAVTTLARVFQISPTELPPYGVLKLEGPLGAEDEPGVLSIGSRSSEAVETSDGYQLFRLPADIEAGTYNATITLAGYALTGLPITVEDGACPQLLAAYPTEPVPGQVVALELVGSMPTLPRALDGFSGGQGLTLYAEQGPSENLMLVAIPDSATGGETLSVDLGSGCTVELEAGEVPSFPAFVLSDTATPGGRIAVSVPFGGGLPTAVDNLRLLAECDETSYTLEPVEIDRGTAWFVLPDISCSEVALTPQATMNGIQVSATTSTLRVTSNVDYSFAVESLRGAELEGGILSLLIGDAPAPASCEDVELRLINELGTVRFVPCIRMEETEEGLILKFPVVDDFIRGVSTASVRFRTGGQWSSWSPEVALAGDPALELPVAAHLEGYAGSVWRTDLAVLNRGSTDETVQVTVPDSSGAEFSVPAGGITFLQDLVGLLGESGSFPSKLDLSWALVATSRTYNLSTSGTFGQSVPVFGEARQLVAGGSYELVGLRGSSGFRSNIGLANLDEQKAVAKVELFSGEGALLWEKQVEVEPGQLKKLNKVFQSLAGTTCPAGRARITVLSGKLTAYGSVVDEVTGDPYTVLPVRTELEAARKLVVPACASVPGYEGTYWKTDLVLFNPGATSAHVTYALASHGAEESLELAPQQVHLIEDVAAELGLEGNGYLQIQSDVPVVASARVYNQSSSGTFGQVLRGEASWVAIREGETGWLFPLLAGDFRSNLGMVNWGDQQTTVSLVATDGEGQLLWEKEVSLAPGELKQMFRIVDSGPSSLRVSVIFGGPVSVYASVVDNSTGDATTLVLAR